LYELKRIEDEKKEKKVVSEDGLDILTQKGLLPIVTETWENKIIWDSDDAEM
jgi:hypothetical protein